MRSTHGYYTIDCRCGEYEPPFWALRYETRAGTPAFLPDDQSPWAAYFDHVENDKLDYLREREHDKEKPRSG